MTKNCSYCGNELDINATVCPICGTQVVREKQKKNKIWGILILLMVAVMVGIVGFTVIYASTGGNYPTAVNDANKLMTGDTKMIKAMLPDAAVDYWEENDTDFDELAENGEEFYDNFVAAQEEDYGDGFSMKLIVSKAKRSSETKVKNIAAALKDTYGIKKDSVDQAFLLESYIKYEGEDAEDDVDQENLYAVKIDGKWYLVFYVVDTEPSFFCENYYNMISRY